MGKLSAVLVERFLNSSREPPREIKLDFDATDDRVHGNQEIRFFHVLSSFAYVLVETLRREHLAGTDLAQAQVDTIRLKLFKVAARVVTSVRRVVLHLSSSYRETQQLGQDLFRRVVASLIVTPPVHPVERLAASNSKLAGPVGGRGRSAHPTTKTRRPALNSPNHPPYRAVRDHGSIGG